MTFKMASRISIAVASICLALLIPSVATFTSFSVWSGENLDDLIMNTDGSGITDKHALLVIYDSSCSEKMKKLGISTSGIPHTRTLAYLQHDYVTVQTHTWFKDNGDDLRLRFKVVNCPEVLFIPRGSTKSDPVVKWQWSLDPNFPSTPFLTWVWAQLKVKVTILNAKDSAAEVHVNALGLLGPDPEAHPQFTIEPGETKEISIYESSLVMAYETENSGGSDPFIGAWEIRGPTVITLQSNPRDTRLEAIVRLDFQDMFQKEESKARGWLKSNSDRYLLNLKQPLFVQNLTLLGYHKRKIPDKWYKVLRQVYQAHKPLSLEETHGISSDSVINYDEMPTDIVPLTEEVKTSVADGLRPVMEEWCDCKLEMTAFYGIRVYYNGSILRNHVDRIETHVISLILQIDQQVRSPWLLEIIDYHGDRHHVALSPGEMLLYESTKLVHGRPQPLNGELYANAFVHYRPLSGWKDYSLQPPILQQGDRKETLTELNSPLTKSNAYKRKVVHAESNIKDEL